jgi:hypothetical protein
MALIRPALLFGIVFWVSSLGILNGQTISMVPEERLKLFATCAGRFEALAGHYSATDNPDLPRTINMLGQFDDLVSAVSPHTQKNDDTQAQDLRRSAQQKMTSLILSIRLGVTQQSEFEANKVFTNELQICASLLLPIEN